MGCNLYLGKIYFEITKIELHCNSRKLVGLCADEWFPVSCGNRDEKIFKAVPPIYALVGTSFS